MNLIVRPGNAEIVQEASDLFGSSRVVYPGFREPVQLNNLTPEEANMAIEYFQEQGKKVVEA